MEFHIKGPWMPKDGTLLISLPRSELSETLKKCRVCAKDDAAFMCSKCRKVRYCSAECQKLNWPTHKDSCNLKDGVPSEDF